MTSDTPPAPVYRRLLSGFLVLGAAAFGLSMGLGLLGILPHGIALASLFLVLDVLLVLELFRETADDGEG